MRQRVALIRTLVNKPDILLLDEPFASLDYQTRLYVIDDVYRIIKEEKKAAIIVTHDISEAISIADRIIVLSGKPTRIKSIHKINIKDDTTNTPLLCRSSPLFPSFFSAVLEDLTNNET